MKRMAAVLAVTAGLAGLLPAAAPAASSDREACSMLLVLRFC
jgi:hypothetical protein